MKIYRLAFVWQPKACFKRRISVASNAIQTIDHEVNHTSCTLHLYVISAVAL